MTRARNASGRTYVGNGSYDIGALEQRVYGIEKGQAQLAERIDSLSQTLDARMDRLTQAMERRSQPPWQAITVLLLVLVPMIGGVFTLLSQSQRTLRADILALNQVLVREVGDFNDRLDAQLVPRAELDDRREISGQRTERIEADIQRLIASTYPREVHLERWSAFTAELDHVREEIKTVRDDVNAISPTGNVLDSLAERIERLESRWIDRRMDPNDGPPIP